MAISWAAYGVEVGIHRLMDGFARHGAKASVMTNAVIAERAPDTVKAIAERGHEVLSHSYAMDVIPALLSDEDERKNIDAAPRFWKSLRPKNRRLAVAARHLEARHAEIARRCRLSLVRRCVRHRSALFANQATADRRHSAGHDVNDMPLMKYGHPPRMMLELFNEMIGIARARDDEPRIIDVTSHAHIFGHHRGAHFYERIIEHARRRRTFGSARAPKSPTMC